VGLFFGQLGWASKSHSSKGNLIEKVAQETWLSTLEEFANPYLPKATCLQKLPKDYAL
jgi:hypothetical protein